MKYLSNDHKTVPMHKNNHNHKQCNKMENSIVNMMENQWKLRQQHGQNRGKGIVEQILASEERAGL